MATEQTFLTWGVVTVSQHTKIVTFEIAFEVLKGHRKIFGHFWQCSEVFRKLSECSEAAGMESCHLCQVFLVCNHVTTERGHVGDQYNRFFLE